MPDLSVDCADCGKTLEVIRATVGRGDDIRLEVSACEDCLEQAKEEGREEASE